MHRHDFKPRGYFSFEYTTDSERSKSGFGGIGGSVGLWVCGSLGLWSIGLWVSENMRTYGPIDLQTCSLVQLFGLEDFTNNGGGVTAGWKHEFQLYVVIRSIVAVCQLQLREGKTQ